VLNRYLLILLESFVRITLLFFELLKKVWAAYKKLPYLDDLSDIYLNRKILSVHALIEHQLNGNDEPLPVENRSTKRYFLC